MTSLPMDMPLPSPWDPDRVMAEAVFGPCADGRHCCIIKRVDHFYSILQLRRCVVCTADCQETTIALSGTPTEMPYYSSGNSFLQGQCRICIACVPACRSGSDCSVQVV
jgi:hypothetical protein